MSAPMLHLKTVQMLLSSSWRWPQNIGVSFLPLRSLLFILLGPWSMGPGGTVLTPLVSLSSLPSCPLALKSSCPGRREAKCGGYVPQSCL